MERLTPAPLLSSMLDDWARMGWPLEDLHAFRMEEGAEGEGDGEAGGEGAAGDAKAGEGTKTPEELVAEAQAEVEKWKSQSRKHEERSKANAKAASELETLKTSQLSDTEKVVAEAEARGRQAATVETSQKLAAAEIKAALAGVVPDPAGIVEDLNLGKYVTDTGDVDTEAVSKLREKYEALAKPAKGGGPDLKQGSRGTGAPAQLAKADLARMSPEEIVKAQDEGRLHDVLSGKST